VPINVEVTAVCSDTTGFFERKNEERAATGSFDNNSDKLKLVLSLELTLVRYLWINSAKV
jgi:hypothetical protein